MGPEEALAFLGAAPAVHVATTAPDGTPILRVLHAVLVDGAVCFHGAPAGEKMEAVGRRAVISVEETVAAIPSFFLDPERACPATTYFRSVQAHGTIEVVEDAPLKGRILQALMVRFQPEGGYVPIAHDHPLYRKAVDGVLILRVPMERVDGKSKLGQNRRPEELARVVEHLWRRGAPGDVRAIELVLRANPKLATPAFLAAPEGAVLACQLGPDEVEAAVELLSDTYWNHDVPKEVVARAQLGSTAWVGARDGAGKLIACARAISDGAKYAWIYDVVVAPAWRGRGVGEAVMRLLVDHPAVRGARVLWLSTKDAQSFYARLGFIERGALPPKPYPAVDMARVR
jgi:N-acetylglutamate synthase-like GNAT family acetyltransferase/nitroimidazol reductase NimA-like FMN-containing flavoprotein (pyridoxamine 5'-phosphate oxidase superfamily)